MTVHEVLSKAAGLQELVGRESDLRAEAVALAKRQRAAEAERQQMPGDGPKYAELGEELDVLHVRARRVQEELVRLTDRVRAWKAANADDVVGRVLSREAELFAEVRATVVPRLQAIAEELQELGSAVVEVDKARGVVLPRALTALLSPDEVLDFAVRSLSYCSADEPARSAEPVVLRTPARPSRPHVVVTGG